jgi:hypothetical protein
VITVALDYVFSCQISGEFNMNMKRFRTTLSAQAYLAVRTPINQLSISFLMNQEPTIFGFLLFSQ